MNKVARDDRARDVPPVGILWHSTLLLALMIALTASGFFWLVPLEVLQQWAFDRAGDGPFDKFEAIGKVEFAVWLARVTLPVLVILIWRVWTNLPRWRAYWTDAWSGFAAITTSAIPPEASIDRWLIRQIRTVSVRALVIGWAVLFAVHAALGIELRMHDWPYFRWNSGDVVLPNVSDSNRAVIRYLREATPPGSRILVASDQKLFFLSYYLRPRTLFHRMHPESEHVIPLKEQQRKLNAFQLEELSESDLARIPHDYTLEYFEHPDLVNRSRVLDDAAWVTFIRRWEQNPSLVPSYVVRLRRTGEPR